MLDLKAPTLSRRNSKALIDGKKKITPFSLPLLSKGKIAQAHLFSNSVRQINLHIMTDELVNSLLSCLSNWFLLELA